MLVVGFTQPACYIEVELLVEIDYSIKYDIITWKW